ncbi:MAG: NUDIX domain-containing protein, partial [bacterium]|nr:NUDIX domain-containing protein [bacterium]
IQKRSKNVPSPEKWDQSVGGHVDEGESYLEAAARELAEELGVKDIPLQEIAKFYTENMDGAKTMKRFNTLYWGDYDGEIKLNPEETSEIRWVTLDALATWMEEKPQDFAQGFITAFNLYSKENPAHRPLREFY